MRKRKLIVLAMATALCSGTLLAGCGGETAPQTSNASLPTVSSNLSESMSQNSNVPTGTDNRGDLGDYNVEILGVRTTENSDKEPIAIVKYKFTNVSDEEATSFSQAIRTDVFQNGVELKGVHLIMSSDYDGENLSKKIKKGASLEVESCYVLDDTTSDIEVEAFRNSILIADQKEKVTATLSLPKT